MSTVSSFIDLFDPVNDMATQQVIDAVRDSIEGGLIDEPIEVFEHKLKHLTECELEEYLQDLWDEI